MIHILYLPVGITLDNIPNGIYYDCMNETLDTRTTILETALDLFALRGFDSVGTQEIVDKAGITKPTMYHYFGHKRGLLDTIVSEYGGKLFRTIQQAAEYNHNIVLTLNTITRETMRFALSNQAFFRLKMTMSVAAPESETYAAYRPLREGLNECFEKLFRAAAEDHGNMKGREKSYSESFQGMLGVWTLLILNKELELNDQSLERVVHHFMHGIFS